MEGLVESMEEDGEILINVRENTWCGSRVSETGCVGCVKDCRPVAGGGSLRS